MCIGMCFESSAIEQYHHIINRIITLLEGTDTSILEEMKEQMIHASGNFDFEKAAKIRDTIEAINTLLKKEKVIGFTKENKNIVMIESISDGVLKLFLIKGNKVLFKQMVELDDATTKQLGAWIKSTIIKYFKTQAHPLSIEISKDEIDEAQIIYSYLKNNACEYLIIPEQWLNTENHDNINLAINEFLNTKLEKVPF
jgi:excinuclease ABC subunit C